MKRKPCNPISLIYFANRYIGILGEICFIVSMSFNVDLLSCRLTMWTGNLCNYVLHIRVLALYHQDKRLSIFLKILLCLEAGIGLVELGGLMQGVTFCATTIDLSEFRTTLTISCNSITDRQFKAISEMQSFLCDLNISPNLTTSDGGAIEHFLQDQSRYFIMTYPTSNPGGGSLGYATALTYKIYRDMQNNPPGLDNGNNHKIPDTSSFFDQSSFAAAFVTGSIIDEKYCIVKYHQLASKVILSLIILSLLLVATSTSTFVHKRGDSKTGTFRNLEYSSEFEGLLGACGVEISNTEYQVTLNVEYYGDAFQNPHCKKNITIKVGGKSAKGQFVDKCTSCYDADISPALYKAVMPDGTNTDYLKGAVPLLHDEYDLQLYHGWQVSGILQFALQRLSSGAELMWVPTICVALTTTSKVIYKRTDTTKGGFARWDFDSPIPNMMGACEVEISNDIPQVSLNIDYYGNNIEDPNCKKNIIITVGNRSAMGQFVDKCMTCPDAYLSPALYDKVMPDGTNTDWTKGKVPFLQGSWEFEN
ncbi:uncharacterized protein FOMMEDRAFT_27246 [Fomitiporia mediterranea MF3/22]|uniref:uncharacterized protein n=1 Tax=Fomitiporia mediterranea (strain MF3/22) TaxID=694068 RepID=UPI000440922E|nr:uncharacterized protein FOMMEDRAFT_27246 [Fomitiporia mediterranea MF3/22]EJD04976.1 hypothetical protein FOMMEDRAFT_27246 [Fomitiporia mediterranea MF3/22]